MEIPSLRRETRYGMPAADHYLFNRHYIIGYSYYFRQAKWALEILSGAVKEVHRLDKFREDLRVPENFRVQLVDFEGFKDHGYDRGHLVASANQQLDDLQNSETFLLSNMSPQKAGMNRGLWKKLEGLIRDLSSKQVTLTIDEERVKKNCYFEIYVICGPVFYFDKPVQEIGVDDDNHITIPVPHAFFKSILAEDYKGKLRMWSFILPNQQNLSSKLADYQEETRYIERLVGIKLWDRLLGKEVEKLKTRKEKLWFTE